MPRPETLLLLFAFAATVGAKLLAVRGYRPASVLTSWASVVVSDVVFFSAVIGAVALGYALRPGRLLARAAMIVALLILGWSVANVAWLRVTGVQLQFGVLPVILLHPAEFWPTVRPYVVMRPAVTVVGGVVAVLLAIWAGRRIVRPVPVVPGRRRHASRAGVAAAVMIALGLVQLGYRPGVNVGSLGQVLDYSTHWYALVSTIAGSAAAGDTEQQSRSIPRVGERAVKTPAAEHADLPNVVLLMLESVSYASSGLGEPERGTMPALARLASEAVEFVNTRVPVSQTGKAFWATLCGTIPDVYHDYSEAILVDKPYEGLPSLLRRAGYRSAFFQMAKGSFECAPGTFANFAFDWAWFRENLEDPSANLGYLAGDDFRMLDPALAWATQDDRPFLLMMITSAAHDPYEVPTWFAAPEKDDYAKYVQALQYTDAFVEEVCRRLERCGLTDRTLLCVLGDHGESFRAESRRGRWVSYEEVLRVPWVIRWPGHVPAGLRRQWPCSQMDVTPTILSLLGYDVSDAGFEGRDAMTPLDGARRLYFSAWYEGSPLGYTEGSRKVVYWPRNGRVFECDLNTDPGECSPLLVEGAQRDRVIEELMKWKQGSYIEFDAKRFRKRFLFGHWWAFSSGRYGRAYYVP